ncbi:TCP-1/cpn60 chaperonin family protein [Candidatus Woesearchaeota archaeon]|nr:TCP-1/cpn60 chaperonin family protein [Candidatus Woesearchaeota archaeon]
MDSVQPIFIMPDDSKRSSGKNAQKMNISAAKQVAETVKSTLGPKGMDKMLVDSMGDVTITNDGVTILNEISIEHPSAKMIVEVAKTQESEVGDGTTTAVILAGELLKKSEDLLDQEIHPTVIIKGYRLAAEKAQVILNNIAESISEHNNELLKNIAITGMTGKGAEVAKEKLSDLAVNAVKSVMEKENGSINIDLDNIKIEKKVGASVEDSEIVEGIILDKEKIHPGMPKVVKNAKVALIDSPIEIKSTEMDAKIQITDPGQMQSFLDQEEKMIKDMVNKIIKSGADVMFCQKGVDDIAQHFLAKKEIYVCRRVKASDMKKLSRATGAKIITNLDDLSKNDLGNAGVVEESKVGDEDMTYVKKCKNAKSVTLLLRGGTEHVTDEIKRAMDDAIGDVAAAIKVGKVVGGAGSIEIELSRNLDHFANSLSGRERLAVQAFANAMEVIPRTLAENAGLDPIDVITEMKAMHDKGKKWAGVDISNGRTIDVWKMGIIEPLKIKTQALSSAAEVATMILRIDDVIMSESNKEGGMGGGMPPGGMGGMPPM